MTSAAFSRITHIKIGTPHRAAAHIHKLREGAPRVPRVVFAQHRLVAVGQRFHVKLHHVCARLDPLTMPLAFLVGAQVDPVFHHNARAFDPFTEELLGVAQARVGGL